MFGKKVDIKCMDRQYHIYLNCFNSNYTTYFNFR